MIRNNPRHAAVYGVDLAKKIFPIQKAKFRRETLLQFFERAKHSA
jgi:hypothetical protein